jgi:hypothetical protein
VSTRSRSPYGISGMNSKFMPKMPAIRFSGRKMAVSAVSVRMMFVGAVADAEKWICTAVSAPCSMRRTWCTTRWMCSTTSRARASRPSRSPSHPGRRLLALRVQPFLHGVVLLLAQVFQHVQRVARDHQRAPVGGSRLAGGEQAPAASGRARCSAPCAARGSCRPSGSACAASGRPLLTGSRLRRPRSGLRLHRVAQVALDEGPGGEAAFRDAR